MKFNEIAQEIYKANKEKGFWDKERNFGELLMLVTSELGEAMESHRKGKFANIQEFQQDKQGTPFHQNAIYKSAFEDNIKDTVEDEIADAIIRLFDLAGGLNIDLDFHIQHKLHYNSLREKLHGKNY